MKTRTATTLAAIAAITIGAGCTTTEVENALTTASVVLAPRLSGAIEKVEVDDDGATVVYFTPESSAYVKYVGLNTPAFTAQAGQVLDIGSTNAVLRPPPVPGTVILPIGTNPTGNTPAGPPRGQGDMNDILRDAGVDGPTRDAILIPLYRITMSSRDEVRWTGPDVNWPFDGPLGGNELCGEAHLYRADGKGGMFEHIRRDTKWRRWENVRNGYGPWKHLDEPANGEVCQLVLVDYKGTTRVVVGSFQWVR